MWIQFWIFFKGEGAGCAEVRLMYDGTVHLHRFRPNIRNRWRSLRIKCKVSTADPPAPSTSQNYRDHRKILGHRRRRRLPAVSISGRMNISIKVWLWALEKIPGIMIQETCLQFYPDVPADVWDIDVKKEKLLPVSGRPRIYAGIRCTGFVDSVRDSPLTMNR